MTLNIGALSSARKKSGIYTDLPLRIFTILAVKT